jgi:hypothetical protein
MANYSGYDVKELARRARAQIELDEKYARERQESYRAKRRLRIDQIITAVVMEAYGKVTREIVEQVKRLLPREWFN